MTYKIADVVFDVKPKYNYSKEFMKEYEYDGESQEQIEISEEELKEFGKENPNFPPYYLESLCIFKHISEILLRKYQGIIFHCSALRYDGEVYAFTAPSGTGKSTHARMWREVYGDKVEMINDDKPLMRYVDGKFIVYGTPWTGKHCLGSNTKGELKAIIKLERGENNEIHNLSKSDALVTIFNQTLRPTDETTVDNLFCLIDKMLSSVELYELKCNVSHEAAIMAHDYIIKK